MIMKAFEAILLLCLTTAAFIECVPGKIEGSVVLLNPTSVPVPESSTDGHYVNTEKLIQQSAKQIEEAIEKSERKSDGALKNPVDSPVETTTPEEVRDAPTESKDVLSTTSSPSSSINPVIETTTEATKPMKEKVSQFSLKKTMFLVNKKKTFKKMAKLVAGGEQVQIGPNIGEHVDTTESIAATTWKQVDSTTEKAALATDELPATTQEAVVSSSLIPVTAVKVPTSTESAVTSTSPSTPTSTSPQTSGTDATTLPEVHTDEATVTEAPDEADNIECASKISLAGGYKMWRSKDKNRLNLTLATDNLGCSITAGLSVSSNTTSHLVLDAQVGDQILLHLDELVSADTVVSLHKSQEDALTECVEPPHGTIVWNKTENFVIDAGLLMQSGLQFFAVAVRSDNAMRVWHIRLSVYDNECESKKDSGDLCSAHGVCALAPGESTYTCHCCASIKGRACEEYDACATGPCRNNGFCVDISEGLKGSLYQCLCPHAYRGTNCEQNADFCEMHKPCKNNATCSSSASPNGTEYSCLCQKGFEGPNCEVNIDECESKPCVHGMCEDGLGEFKCYCLPGYGGELCEFEYDECDSSPCVNNGACEDLIAGYKCHCGPGYTGRRCEIKVDLCKPNPCSAPATCIDRGNNYTCVCRGSGCSTREQLDPCYPNPCQHGGSCWPSMDTFYCSCPPGFAGDNCEEIAYPQAIAERRVYEPTSENHRPSSDRLHNIYVACATLAGACALVAIIVTVCQCRLSKNSVGEQLQNGCERLKNPAHIRGQLLPTRDLPSWQRF